jgi:hypothetical protein
MTTVYDLLARMRADTVIARVWAQGMHHLQALACHLCWTVPEAGHRLSGVVSIVQAFRIRRCTRITYVTLGYT